MPAVPGSMYQQGGQPSCFDKMKYGEKNSKFCLFSICFQLFINDFRLYNWILCWNGQWSIVWWIRSTKVILNYMTIQSYILRS
jgi:hypothetical protein